MLTPRQRQICAVRDRLDHLTYSKVGFGSFAVGLAAIGFLVPVGAPLFFTAAAIDVLVTFTLHLRAARLRRRLDELTFFSR